jgi:hypothetical protein
MTSKEKRLPAEAAAQAGRKIMRYEAIRNKICSNPDRIGISYFIPAKY